MEVAKCYKYYCYYKLCYFDLWALQEYIYLKTLITVLVILASVIGILRINLPSNDIDEQLATNQEANFLERAMTGMMFSNSVAEWQYIDLVVVKFACSERLEMTLIALPFKRWQSYDDKRSICTDD